MTTQRSRKFWLATQVVFLVAVFGAGVVGGDVALGAMLAGTVAAGMVAFEVARRRGFDIAGLATGVGDERVTSIYRDAGSRTSEMLIYALTIWLTVEVARGEADGTLLAVVLLYAALWVGNMLWLTFAGRRPAKRAV